MSALNEPVAVECPRCGCTVATQWRRPGDHKDYRCPACGEFSISGTQEGFLRNMPGGIAAARLIERDGRMWLESRISDEMLDYPDCRPVRESSIKTPAWLQEIKDQMAAEKAQKAAATKPHPG